jgi:hypothetical protein
MKTNGLRCIGRIRRGIASKATDGTRSARPRGRLWSWSNQDRARSNGRFRAGTADPGPERSIWSLAVGLTLRKLAKAFDLALTVRFESFGWLLDDSLSSSREALERPSFGEDPAFGKPGINLTPTAFRKSRT